MALSTPAACALLTHWSLHLFADAGPLSDAVTHAVEAAMPPAAIDLPLLLVHEGRLPIALVAIPAPSKMTDDPLVEEALAVQRWGRLLRARAPSLAALATEGPALRQWAASRPAFVTSLQSPTGALTVWWSPSAPAHLGWRVAPATRINVRVLLPIEVDGDGLWLPETADALPVHWQLGGAVHAGTLSAGPSALKLTPAALDAEVSGYEGLTWHLRAETLGPDETAPFALTGAGTGPIQRGERLVGHGAWVSDGERLGVRVRLTSPDDADATAPVRR